MYRTSRALYKFKALSIRSYRSTKMSTQAVPIILCGRREQIGAPVIELLKPEYEVVYFIPTDEDGVANIPRLLTGEKPQEPVSHIGSGNYSSTPVAVVLGGGYQEESVSKFRDAVNGTPDARRVPFLRADVQKTKESGVTMASPPYPEEVAQRVKDLLAKLKQEGKLDGSDDNDHYW